MRYITPHNAGPLIRWVMATIITLQLIMNVSTSCNTPPAPTSEARAEALVRAEIVKNSMGLIEAVEIELTRENDTTYRADYRFLVPQTKDRWRTVNMRYVFDKEMTEIKHKERL